MTRLVPLAPVPNQEFTLVLDETRMRLAIKEARGVMVTDFERAGVTLLTGTRAIAGEPIIPYRYLEEGNFIFLTLNGDLPDWRQFGETQSLIYLSAAEIEEIRAAGSPIDADTTASYLVSDEGFYLTTDTGELLTDD